MVVINWLLAFTSTLWPKFQAVKLDPKRSPEWAVVGMFAEASVHV